MSTSQQRYLRIRGASENNLKNIDLEIPRNQFVVVTGISGSGKSTLAHDVICREGQRRFVESLSAYARQYLGRLDRPKVEHVEGLSPTISIDQKTISRNPRSTVGTITEILDHLRLLFARLGVPHCPSCGDQIEGRSVDQIVASAYHEHEGSRLLVTAPIVLDRKGEYRKELQDLRDQGFVRVRIDGEVKRLDEEITLQRYERHTIEVVLDRLILEGKRRSRFSESVEKALEISDGLINLVVEGNDHLSSSRFACTRCDRSLPEIEPRLFSFNSVQGACNRCDGLGKRRSATEEQLVPDRDVSLADGALALRLRNGRFLSIPFTWKDLEGLAEKHRFKLTTPFRRLSKRARGLILEGTGDGSFEGLIPMMEASYDVDGGRLLERLMPWGKCRGCDGTRLREEPRAVRFRDQSIDQITALTVDEAMKLIGSFRLEDREVAIGEAIFSEISGRLGFLKEVGLSYLALDRSADTLSGGEAQRIRLASQLGSGLKGVMYVLDEPSIGLHATDNQALLKMLRDLRDLGNSVLVVEHDQETIESADHVVDVGPGAGSRGGEVVGQGTVSEIRRSARSVTGRYLDRREKIEVPELRRRASLHLTVVGARQHNLRNLDVEFPLGVLTAVTGVSGSGKSTLVEGILKRGIADHLGLLDEAPGAHTRIDGVEEIDKLICIDQSPIGRTPRSNPGTYSKAFDEIRELFSKVPEARARGYRKGRFSFNVKGGRCENCQGAGVNTIAMQFMADIQVTCEECSGRRYNSETLDIRYRGLNIAEVLGLSIEKAADFFAEVPQVFKILETLVAVGLGYVRLGQPSTTLSGGEAQRVKLAQELRKRSTGRTFYILDEPTTGLHFEDVARLLGCLSGLIEAGNSVVVIEHNLDVIKCADHVIDLGPEGGEGGGQLVAVGTPELVAKSDGATGRALATALEGKKVPVSRKGRKRVPGPEPEDRFIIEGARQHNLKNIKVEIPRGKLTVVTGPSGSGKSTLAFDILFAEGQRRYVESLSTYARRFLGRLDRAQVDRVEGIAPAIAIDQKNRGGGPRSTVATSTELYDYLRILFARAGIPHCVECRKPMESTTPALSVRRIVEKFSDRKTLLLAPPGEELRTVDDLRRQGFVRVCVDGEIRRLDEIDDEEQICEGRQVEIVLDRVRPSRVSRSRLAESVEEAYRCGADRMRVVAVDEGDDLRLTRLPSCPDGHSMLSEELTPRLFSFNHHSGACRRCNGIGVDRRVDPRLLITDPTRPIFDGAMAHRLGGWIGRKKSRVRKCIEAALEHHNLNPAAAVESLGDEGLRILFAGTGEIRYPVTFRTFRKGRSRRATGSTWEGLIERVGIWHRRASSLAWRRAIEEHLAVQECPGCGGGRLRKELLHVEIGGLSISDICRLTVEESINFFTNLELEGWRREVAEQVHVEIGSRLKFLEQVGLGYLGLDRSTESLSGGEAQRIRLATQIGNRLVGVLYVLDEPTIGLHQRDNEKLLKSLLELRDQGNSLVVVEHDEQTIRLADHLLDLGPGSGIAGGDVVSCGSPQQVENDPRSPTGRFLSGRESIPIPLERRAGDDHPLKVIGASTNNLKSIEVTFPGNTLTVVTGVSGSGKSSLVMDILANELQHQLAGARPMSGPHKAIEGIDHFDSVGIIDQSPLGRSPASNAATYTGIMTPIRKLYSMVPESRLRGFGPGRFSFNVADGRCDACEGKGGILVEMHFLSDVWVTCEICGGRRFNDETLKIRYRGHSVADILDLEVAEALEVFSEVPQIATMLTALDDVGLGYLPLGQSATTLSGGEAQRVKLASELGKQRRGRKVYILDEPTTGLHFQDVRLLVAMLHRLVDRGDTVIVIEHNLDVIASADHVIDIGLEGGDRGGEVVVCGTPEMVAKHPVSHTGIYLAKLLENSRGKLKNSPV